MLLATEAMPETRGYISAIFPPFLKEDLLKIMKLQGAGADDVKEVREIVQHLFTNIVKPARIKRDSRQAKTHVDNLLLQLVDDMLPVWNTDSFPGSSPRMGEEGNR